MTDEKLLAAARIEAMNNLAEAIDLFCTANRCPLPDNLLTVGDQVIMHVRFTGKPGPAEKEQEMTPAGNG